MSATYRIPRPPTSRAIGTPARLPADAGPVDGPGREILQQDVRSIARLSRTLVRDAPLQLESSAFEIVRELRTVLAVLRLLYSRRECAGRVGQRPQDERNGFGSMCVF